MLQYNTALKDMSFLLKISKFILVPILVEWMGLSEYIVLECCDSTIRLALVDYCKEYNGKFKSSYFDAKLCLPLSPRMLYWLKCRMFDSFENGSLKNTSLNWMLGLLKRNKLMEVVNYFELWRFAASQSHSLDVRVPRSDVVILANQLRKLEFDYCSDVKSLAKLLQHCHMLEELHLIYSFEIDVVLESAGKNCPNLKVLNLSESYGFTEVSLANLLRQTKLTSLDLTACFIYGIRYYSVLEVLHAAIVVHCRHLSVLKVVDINSAYPDFSFNREMTMISQHLRSSLSELGLDRRSSPFVLDCLVANCSELSMLDVAHRVVPPIVLYRIVKKCPLITSLNLNHSLGEYRGSEYLRFLAQLQLKCVHMQTTHLLPEADLNLETVSELSVSSSLFNVAKINLNLQKLSIEGHCVNVESHTHLIEKICVRRYLIHLHLADSIMLTDHDMCMILMACPDLKWLCLNNCSSIGNSTLRHLQQYSLKMKELNISRCYRLSMDTIIDTVVHYRTIELTMNVEEIPNNMNKLLKSCPKLRNVGVQSKMVQNDWNLLLQKLTSKYPDVKMYQIIK